MAAWIPVFEDTPDKDQILNMAGILDRPPNEVFGATMRFWLWAIANTRDGYLPKTTTRAIDYACRLEGLADAMIEVGWLVPDRHNGFSIVGWDEFLSTPARARHQNTQRQQKSRRDG